LSSSSQSLLASFAGLLGKKLILLPGFLCFSDAAKFKPRLYGAPENFLTPGHNGPPVKGHKSSTVWSEECQIWLPIAIRSVFLSERTKITKGLVQKVF
jgi:hypothetical protein